MSGFSSHPRNEQPGESQRDTREGNHTGGTGRPATPDMARHIFEPRERSSERSGETSPVSASSRVADLLRTARGRNSHPDTPATNTVPGSHSPESAHETTRSSRSPESAHEPAHERTIQQGFRENPAEGDRNTNPDSGEPYLPRTSLRDLLNRQGERDGSPPPDDQLSMASSGSDDTNALHQARHDNDSQSIVTESTLPVNGEDGYSFHESLLDLAENQREEDHLPHTYGPDGRPDHHNNPGEDRAERHLRDNASEVLTIVGDYGTRAEKLEAIERMDSASIRSKALIASLEEHYGDNIAFQQFKQYIEREEIKINALDSDLDKTEEERSNDIKQWKGRKRADLQQSRDNEELGLFIDTMSIFTGIGAINAYSGWKEGPSLGKQVVRPLRAYQHREGHQLQARFGSAERTPLQDQEFRGRNWQPQNIHALIREVEERNALLENLNDARGTEDSSIFSSQKYSPEEQRCLDDISDAIHWQSGRDTTRDSERDGSTYISDKLLGVYGLKAERQIRREEIILLKQDLRLRTRVGEGDIDEQKARAAAREDLFNLPTSTLKKTTRLLLKEKEYRDQEQQQNASPDIRQGKTTLFEREAREHAAFGISDIQLEILTGEAIKELTSRSDARNFATFLQDIQRETQLKDLESRKSIRQFSAFLKQETSHLKHAIKNMEWIRRARKKPSEKNKSIERALQKTVLTQRTALESLSLSSSARQEGSIHSDQDLTAETRTIMNLHWKEEAFMWKHLHRGATVTGESQQGLEQYGIQLINALSNHEIQVLLQRHRRYTNHLRSQFRKMDDSCKRIRSEITLMERQELSRSETRELKELKSSLKIYKKERDKRLSRFGTYREHTESFLDLVAKSHYQTLVTYDGLMQSMI